MATIKELAEAYEPKETKNIADLEKVSTTMDVEVKEFTKGDGEMFSVNIAVIDGEDYRVPTSVIIQLKAIMVKLPELAFFSVSKSGEGLKTTYQVIPLTE